jgi:hypothetical protein
MKLRRAGFVAVMVSVVLAAALSAWKSVEACGPDWEPDVFVDAQHPDDTAAFAAGHLGLLGNKFDSDDYAIAYRYLNGGTVAAEDQKAYVAKNTPDQDWSQLTQAQMEAMRAKEKQQAEDNNGPMQWLLARARYAGPMPADVQKAEFPTNGPDDTVAFTAAYEDDYVNCADPAFRTAVQTLQARAATWGAQSPWLKDWIAGQDAVFANCVKNPNPAPWMPPNQQKPPEPPSLPNAAPAGAPALLEQDRAYQTAAAAFYGKQFEQAAQDFAAIAQDRKSPWSAWGTYLEARATVRKAFAMGKATNANTSDLASFDMPTMQQAQQMLEGLLAEKNPMPSRHAVHLELNFVRLRTETEKRTEEICAGIEGPAPDAYLAQDVTDLGFVLEKQLKIDRGSPLLEWIDAWREQRGDALQQWQTTHANPWLVLALAKTTGSEATAPQLLAAAEKAQPGTPGYETIFYHRVRLLTEMKRRDEARALTDAALPAAIRQGPNSYSNALLGERMALARSFGEFLRFAPRMILIAEPGAKPAWDCTGHPAWLDLVGHCPTSQAASAFGDDAVQVLNRQIPLKLLVEAAQSHELPQRLETDVALAAWTRAVVLKDAASAATVATMLPPSLHDAVGAGVGFKADLAILQHPGLRPYVEAGTTRLNDFEELDPYRDNWWSSNWAGRFSEGSTEAAGGAPPPLSVQSYLTAAQQERAADEYARVTATPNGVILIGQRVIDYARSHPDDASVPEALALTVRATRYASQDWRGNAQNDAAAVTVVSKAAFELLHSRYPESEWTKKTKYYY